MTVSVPDAKDGAAKGEVWLYGVTAAAPVTIGRGENAGRKITYYNVARRLVKVGDWTGKAESWTIPADQIRADGVDGAAVDSAKRKRREARPDARRGLCRASLTDLPTAEFNPISRKKKGRRRRP